MKTVNTNLKYHMHDIETSRKEWFKALIWSVMLYGAETWMMRKEDVKRIEAFKMWIWRRTERISWIGHRTNED